MIQRGSDKHGPKIDDQMKHEVDGVIKGGHPTRAHEEHEPEPMVDDEGVPATDPRASREDEG
ncbi:hypothetical protein [Actinorugispora endophytica]|uniref:Uncharacterized protein n=1 Tax=Actinorugispora endophytica TaxID=1605990 RepID=A0A4R6V7Q4_9ACTN|nr:hypothetical protein [Actinorugispora endophytica]TDQ55282.1 hypothetical protein EV190_101607 [Actinorugispora endophytica]